MTTSTSAATGRALASSGKRQPPITAKRPGIAEVLLPFWSSKEKWLALFLLGITLTISFTGTYGHVALNKVQGELTDALIALDWEKLKPLFVMSMALGLVTVLMPVISAYVSGYLDLRWRTWMTHRYLEKWTSRGAFYSLERDGTISNSDQRIAEDVKLTTDTTLRLFTSVIVVGVNAVTFTVLLWNISGALDFTVFDYPVSLNGYMVYAAFFYCFCNLALAHWLGKSLIGLNMHKQTVEADFRHQGMQVREYAEQIAFYRGGAREQNNLLTRFESVRINTLHILGRTFKVMFGQHLYSHTFSLLPTLLALPLLLAGKITYGDMTRIIGAYGMLASAIAFFPQAYVDFTSWLAVTNRLRDFEWAINKAELQISQIHYQRGAEATLSCDQLTLNNPLGHQLTSLAHWAVAKGERWMVKGPSGSGKSTLLRACAGLWPYGSGAITLPGSRSSLFLPQKSYIPCGTLKDALCYPNASSEFTDEQCRNALIDCCLPGLTQSLTVNQKWQQTLSGGEQQRLAMARVLLHRPDFIFLDEATSALDPVTEQKLYKALLAQLPDSTLVSVAHRTSLEHFHSHTLNLNAS